MLASVTKLFDKSFSIGFLLPVILALLLVAWAAPGLALTAPLRSLALSDKTLGDLTYLALVSYGLALLLSMANIRLFQILEGYDLPGWLAVRLAQRQERKRALWLDEFKVLSARWTLEGAAFTGQARIQELRLKLVRQFPPENQPAMPTAFGNIIRAFEAYPLVAYGADGVRVWPRLSPVIPAAFAAELDDARSQVNFLVNMLFLLPIVVIVVVWEALSLTPWCQLGQDIAALHLGGWHPSAQGFVLIISLALPAPIYVGAVTQAAAWGEVVKAAFDCYLPDLAKKMGYAGPKTHEQRRQFWHAFLQSAAYWNPMDPDKSPLVDYVVPPTPPKPAVFERLRKLLP